MENAVKALLIAAAVIIAIVLITLGMNLLNTGSEQIDNVDFSEYEINQFNDKFKKFEGASVSGSEVNTLITTVFNHNNQQEDKSTKVAVEVTGSGEATDKAADISVDTDATSTTSPNKVATGYRYKVTCEYSKSSKLINKIKVETIENQ